MKFKIGDVVEVNNSYVTIVDPSMWDNWTCPKCLCRPDDNVYLIHYYYGDGTPKLECFTKSTLEKVGKLVYRESDMFVFDIIIVVL